MNCTWAPAFIFGPCGGCREAHGSHIIKGRRAIQFGMNECGPLQTKLTKQNSSEKYSYQVDVDNIKKIQNCVLY